jgi:membrane-associated phospholipid phosphatase
VTRLLADRHYTSDVLAGVVIGGVSGFLLPGWWHFGLFDAGKGPAKTQMIVSPFASGDSVGLGLYGID